MTKPRTIKPCELPAAKLVLRMAEVRPETANEETKSVEVVIATENPVERYDANSGQKYYEILLMDGVQFRTERFRLPIVDSHDRSTVRNVLGSVRDIKVEGTQLVGVASFARDRDSQDAYHKLLDGHLTDFSITATPNESTIVRRGETEVIRDQQITGPAEVMTSWTPTDASLVAAGADETSTVRELRRSYDIPKGKETEMGIDPDMKAELVKMGMPENIENMADALRWRMDYQPEESERMEDHDEDHDRNEETETETTERSIDRKEITRELVLRNKEIRAICQRANIETEEINRFCDSPDVTLDDVRKDVLERMIKKQPSLGTSTHGERIEVVVDSKEKFEAAARDGLICRAMSSISRKSPFAEGYKPAAGYEDFASLNLHRLAEDILRRADLPTMRMTPKDIAMVALGHRPTINRMRHAGIMRDEAYHTTGLLPNLMLDAANKTLMDGYDEAPFTWNIWARQGTSVADFKNINRIRYSESPDLKMVPENDSYPEGKTSDAKESYKVEKFGRLFTITWETVVNDDLDAISRVPQMHGNAARRTQNKHVYAVLTDNANMADGTALFDAGHSNLAGSGAAPSVTTLNAMFTAMRTQTGLEGEIIGVLPRYLIVPASLEATALELFTSTGRPDVGGDTTGNSGVQNIYGPGGRRSLEIVAEPQLDGNSTTAWYGAADNAGIDTVELTFLQGEESPVLENEWDFDKDVYKYKVRQTFGTKAIDWRGLYKNPGA